MRDHRKLEVFAEADELVLAIYEQTKSFPGDERFGLTSQMRRAAVSIASNIVEGSSRPSLPDYVRFLSLSLGSARELHYQLSIARRLEYMNGGALEEKAERVCRMLSGLISSLRPQAPGP